MAKKKAVKKKAAIKKKSAPRKKAAKKGDVVEQEVCILSVRGVMCDG
tara:strand:+ start:319 stop:459 length:141 start_codon:yes stop_codon:yes gene_type:complete